MCKEKIYLDHVQFRFLIEFSGKKKVCINFISQFVLEIWSYNCLLGFDGCMKDCIRSLRFHNIYSVEWFEKLESELDWLHIYRCM
jgi:hypothetical protein